MTEQDCWDSLKFWLNKRISICEKELNDKDTEETLLEMIELELEVYQGVLYQMDKIEILDWLRKTTERR